MKSTEDSQTTQTWPVLPSPSAPLATWAFFYSQICRWRIFPISPGGKRPLVDKKNDIGEHGVKEASADYWAVTRWWHLHPDANIGLACGDLVVLDLDGAEGVENYGSLELRVASLLSVTGGGGFHLIYRRPENVTIRNSVSKIAEKIDVRSRGGYIVLPPSIHESGNAYRWEMWMAPAKAPSYMYSNVAKPIPVPTGPTRFSDGDGSNYGIRALMGEVENIATAGKGSRNDTLYTASLKIGSLVGAGHLNGGSAMEALRRAAEHCWSLTGDRPPEGEITKTIMSGIREGMSKPRVVAEGRR